jgi:hypothetical protein
MFRGVYSKWMNQPYRVSSYPETKQYLNGIPPISDSIECKGSETTMISEKNRTVALGLAILAVGAVVGLVASNKGIREQLNERSKQLFRSDWPN